MHQDLLDIGPRERKRRRNAAWYQKNKEKLRLRQKEWYVNNREVAKLRAKAWKMANPERVRENSKRYNKLYYEKHKSEIIQNTKNRIARVKAWFQEYKNTLKCSKCGFYEDSCVLDFHHRDPKTKKIDISRMYTQFSEEQIVEEIAKCDVLCANCHRIIHKNGV